MGSSPTSSQQQLAGIAGQSLGMGAGVMSSVVAATGGMSGGFASAIGAGTVIPVLDIAAVAAVVASLVFHGADPRQVPASKIEQVFEAAADKIATAQSKGMITRAQADAIMDEFIQAGDQLYQQNPSLGLSTGSPGAKGIANMTSVIQAEKNAKQMITPDNVTIEINPDAVKGYYPTVGTSGWYSDSLQAANQVAAQALSSLPKNFPTTSESTSQVVSDLTSGNLAQLGTDISKSSLFLWGGIILVGLGLWHAFTK